MHKGLNGRPSFKIVGTNTELKKFEKRCTSNRLEVSTLNSYFRDDYEHCLIPCYAYDKNQPENKKLQTLHTMAYQTQIIFSLPDQEDLAFAMVEVINQ